MKKTKRVAFAEVPVGSAFKKDSNGPTYRKSNQTTARVRDEWGELGKTITLDPAAPVFAFPYVFDSNTTIGGNTRQPFQATCRKCNESIYFDLDDDGTPGFNGDWSNGYGDAGCAVDNGDDSEDGNSHVPHRIFQNRSLFPTPYLTIEMALVEHGEKLYPGQAETLWAESFNAHYRLHVGNETHAFLYEHGRFVPIPMAP